MRLVQFIFQLYFFHSCAAFWAVRFPLDSVSTPLPRSKSPLEMQVHTLCILFATMAVLRAVDAGTINLYGLNPGAMPIMIGDPVRLSLPPHYPLNSCDSKFPNTLLFSLGVPETDVCTAGILPKGHLLLLHAQCPRRPSCWYNMYIRCWRGTREYVAQL